MKENLLDHSKKYIIGVSGGCDSMYLLHLLHQLQYDLIVCHVNYHYREDSNEDTALVKTYCDQHHIPLYIKECDTGEYHHGNFQDNARNIRYDFYKEIAQKYHTSLVLLAHHKDDYLENVLMQLEKHQTYFYLGIKESNEVNGLNIIRPLLDTYKKDIKEYCNQNHIPYRDDYTNFETYFKRDQIRNTVLDHYSLNEKEALYHKASLHNERIQYIKESLSDEIEQYDKQGFIDYTCIKQKLLSFFIYLIVYDAIKDKVTASIVEEIIKQIHSNKPNITVNLPVNKVFIKEYNNIYVSNKEEDIDYEYTVNKDEFFSTAYFKLTDHGPVNSGVDVREDEFPLTIRNARKNDTVKTSGGTKKVTRLFINAKVPLSKRKLYPIVLNQYNEIILIPNITKNYTHLSTNANVFVII